MYYTSCWAFPANRDGDLHAVARVVCHPRDVPWFVIKDAPQARGIAALSKFYIEYMNASLLNLRASFTGLAGMVNDLFPHSCFDHNDRRNSLEHGWFHFNVLDFLPEFAAHRFSYDIRLSASGQQLDAIEAKLEEALLQQGRDHKCDKCSEDLIVGNGNWNIAADICNERSSAFPHSNELGLRIACGCQRRPKTGSLFCTTHYMDDSEGNLGPEIAAHRLIKSQLYFTLSWLMALRGLRLTTCPCPGGASMTLGAHSITQTTSQSLAAHPHCSGMTLTRWTFPLAVARKEKSNEWQCEGMLAYSRVC